MLAALLHGHLGGELRRHIGCHETELHVQCVGQVLHATKDLF